MSHKSSPATQHAAERQELMQRACAHLTNEQLREGVVSRKVAGELRSALDAADIAVRGLLKICIEVGTQPTSTTVLLAVMRAALAAYEQELSRGKN